MDERTAKAFDFANDLTKQLLTLATATLAFSVAFFEKVPNRDSLDLDYLYSAWVAMLLSTVAGIVAMGGLTSSLQPRNGCSQAPSIQGANVRLPVRAQAVTFLIGLVLFVLYAWGV